MIPNKNSFSNEFKPVSSDKGPFGDSAGRPASEDGVQTVENLVLCVVNQRLTSPRQHGGCSAGEKQWR